MYNSYLSSVLAYSLILLPCRSYIYYDECTDLLFLMLEIPHIVSSPNIFIPISVFRKVLKSFSFIYNCLPLLILYFLNPFFGLLQRLASRLVPEPHFATWLWSQRRLMSSLGFSKTLYEIFEVSQYINRALYHSFIFYIIRYPFWIIVCLCL